MDPGTIIGLGLALVATVLSMLMEGGNPAAFLHPAPIVLIVGGTLGVTMASVGLHGTLAIPKLYIKAMTGTTPDRPEGIRTLVRMAEHARREGLLALEDEAAHITDPFLSKGVRLVVDGTDPELVKDILDLDIEAMAGRHHAAATVFTHAAGFAPTIGIIGTVMGLVHVLENLDNPATLGPAIAAAFLATLFGVASANLIYLPVANKLKELSTQEADARTMMTEGILSIQAGDNPRIVEEKLKTFLTPKERETFAEGGAEEAGAATEKLAA
ncbi:MAG: Flagellar motor rotation protein MotA [uncultured Thermoleophilia bacterium]|uniref:Flagellar motor rotation protein MotA n=1 Tax=uncultured Thermoleophilia bacterium TaxID=1497501 RepID=A0A6J4UBH4_9ACTN|nr:MAG: Flagellar motor rotation protein MotA [uncultured Thermoleophilia bacterium]